MFHTPYEITFILKAIYNLQMALHSNVLKYSSIACHPQNGAACVDQVNGYSCKCSGEFSGKFCESGPMVALNYPQTSPCQQHDCKNGVCFQPKNAADYVCQCYAGYSGTAQCSHYTWCNKLWSSAVLDSGTESVLTLYVV